LGWKGLWREFERDYFSHDGFTTVRGAPLKALSSSYQSESICRGWASEVAEVSTGQKSDSKLGDVK
jgi:hypothetical protein